jgi:hypothetical protein
MAIPTVPIANYDFNNPLSYPGSGTTISDLEGGFNLTADATTASTFYPLNSTFTLTGGSSSYIRATTGNYVNTGTNNFSFATWFSLTSFSANPPYTFIFLNGSRQGGYTGYGLNVIGTNLGIHVSGIADINTGFAITLGKWYYVVFTVNSSGDYIVYVNGSSVYSSTGFSPNAFSGSSQLAIGYPETPFTDETFVGRIGSIEFFDSVLSGANVTTLYNDSKSRFPVNSYDFSQTLSYPGTGSTVFDLAGSLDLQIAGTVAYVSNGQASYFDLGAGATNGNYIGTTGLSGLGNTFTISGWARNKGSAGYPLFTAGYESASGTAPGFYYPTVSTVAGHFNYGVNFTDGPCANNTWNFLTYTVDGTTCKLYVNGILVDSISKAAGSEWGTGAFVFGAAVTAGGGINAPNFITADIATFDVYNVALGSTDVANIYAETSPRFLAPVSYYDPQDPASFNNTTAFNDLNGGTDFVFNSTPTYDSTYGAISFDGSNFAVLSNYLTNTWPTGTAAFTMSFWWKTKANNPNKFAYLFFYGNGPNYIVPFSNYGTEGSVAILDNANHAVRTTNAFSEDVWYHFAFVKPAGGTFLDFTVYVNGIDQGALTDIVGGSATFSMAVTNNNSIRIQENNPGFISGGSLAQIWVYDYEVDGTDILQQYNSTKARYDNLVASYDLNSLVSYPGTGNTLYDLSGSNADITLENTSYYDGASYNSLIFTEASGSRGTFTGDLGLGTTTPVFTFFIWVKPTALSTGYTYGTIVQYGKESGSVGGAPAIYPEWNGNNNLSATFGSGKADINTGTPVTLDEWICLATTCDGTTYKLYRNGSLVGSTALSGAQIVSPQQLVLNYLVNNPTVFQTSFEFNFLNVYNTALSAGDITTLYDDTVSRFTTPPAYQGIAGGRQFAQGFNG